MAAVKVGQHFRGHDLFRRAHPEASAGQVQHPVDIVHDRVDLVRYEHHRAVLVVALFVDQGTDGLLVLQVDLAFIMLSAGVYKFTAGYPHNHGMELGLCNPMWG